MEKKKGRKTIYDLTGLDKETRRDLILDLLLFGCCVYRESGDKITYIPIEEWPNECFKNPQEL